MSKYPRPQFYRLKFTGDVVKLELWHTAIWRFIVHVYFFAVFETAMRLTRRNSVMIGITMEDGIVQCNERSLICGNTFTNCGGIVLKSR